MKILLLSDVHLRLTTPQTRTDDFLCTQYEKLRYVLDVYKSENCSLFLQAGDFIDKSNLPDRVKSIYIKLLREYRVKLYMVLGQHDLMMHSLTSLERSSIDVFRSAGCVEFLHSDEPLVIEDLNIYGSSWGKEVPKPIKDKCNILVTHKMIGNEPLFPGHKFIDPGDFIRDHPKYDLILCGDYHYSFYKKVGCCQIVNTGCMVRLTCSDRDREHKPKFCIYDTVTRQIEWFDIPVLPEEQVFDLTKKAQKKEERESVDLTKFFDKLRSDQGKTVSFRDKLIYYCESNNIDSSVKSVLLDVMEEVQCK